MSDKTKLKVVMYHYVRDVATTAYPGIHARSVSEFRSQLDHLQGRYNVVSPEDCLTALAGEKALPESAVLLTFDDGYRDHVATVFPELVSRKLKACFFPSALPASTGSVLDVNKVQFLVATSTGPQLKALLQKELTEHPVEGMDVDALFKAQGHPGRYDDGDTALFKRCLQFALPENYRTPLIDRLFKKNITADEKSFSADLYMSEQDIRELSAAGMTVGCHGYTHRWLNHLPENERQEELDRSLEWMRSLGLPEQGWSLAYPSGGWDADWVSRLEAAGCAMAFTTEAKQATLGEDHRLTLPRLDTNDFPTHEETE